MQPSVHAQHCAILYSTIQQPYQQNFLHFFSDLVHLTLYANRTPPPPTQPEVRLVPSPESSLKHSRRSAGSKRLYIAPTQEDLGNLSPRCKRRRQIPSPSKTSPARVTIDESQLISDQSATSLWASGPLLPRCTAPKQADHVFHSGNQQQRQRPPDGARHSSRAAHPGQQQQVKFAPARAVADWQTRTLCVVEPATTFAHVPVASLTRLVAAQI